MSSIIGFPRTVDERAARLVATAVVAQATLLLVTGWAWLFVPLVAGFALRVAAGPRFSPLALVVTRLIVPRLSGTERQVPGPPKRFAQGIGLVFASTAAALWALGAVGTGQVVLLALAAAASLEAFAGVCLGCIVHARLFGCEDCDDLTARWARLDAGRAETASTRVGG